MCIIVAKKEGYKIPEKNILETCFNNNSDGAGLMYVKNNKVIIDKGYMNFASFYDRIEKLENEIDTVNTPIVFHFRIGTSGNMDGTCTHPFELTDNVEKITKLKNKCDIAVAHNGIINSYTPNGASKLNDTQLFIMNFLYPLYELNNEFYKNEKMQDIIEKVTNSRFAILNKNSELVTIGDWIDDDGILYSNSTYKNYYNSYKYNNYTSYSLWNDLTKLPYEEAIDELIPLGNDEYCLGLQDEFYCNVDYKNEGYLATDYYNQLYLVNEEKRKIKLICDYVDIYDYDELCNLYNK